MQQKHFWFCILEKTVDAIFLDTQRHSRGRNRLRAKSAYANIESCLVHSQISLYSWILRTESTKRSAAIWNQGPYVNVIVCQYESVLKPKQNLKSSKLIIHFDFFNLADLFSRIFLFYWFVFSYFFDHAHLLSRRFFQLC